jgi:hypothetical protein
MAEMSPPSWLQILLARLSATSFVAGGLLFVCCGLAGLYYHEYGYVAFALIGAAIWLALGWLYLVRAQKR